jgi:hypothetical protein
MASRIPCEFSENITDFANQTNLLYVKQKRGVLPLPNQTPACDHQPPACNQRPRGGHQAPAATPSGSRRPGQTGFTVPFGFAAGVFCVSFRKLRALRLVSGHVVILRPVCGITLSGTDGGQDHFRAKPVSGIGGQHQLPAMRPHDSRHHGQPQPVAVFAGVFPFGGIRQFEQIRQLASVDALPVIGHDKSANVLPFVEGNGMTVIVSSHLLTEIEQVATSVGIINEGKMLFQGSLKQLKSKSRPAVIMKTGNNPLARALLSHHGFSPVLENGGLVFEDVTDEQVAKANRTLVEASVDVLRIEERRKNLERIFLDMTGKEASL